MAEGAAQQKKKNLPKRTSSTRLKERRKSSFLNGQKRKEERRKQQLARERANAERRAKGEPTPWERANGIEPVWAERRAAARAIRRDERPSLAVRLLRTENKGRPIPADMRPLWKWNPATMRFERGN